jgi:acyl-CoA reductase-like NAD-dependent aldehyde dehydrogenase
LLGVVSPWNQPFLLSMIDAVPALLAGCAVIVKPSEVTPRFIEPLMRSVSHVPELAAVLAVVPGGPDTGRAILEACDVFSFTGSVPTGRKIAEACAKRFIPAFLELGGKDPAIVTANASLEQAAAAVLRGSVLATGQVCFATERVYVQADVHDEFVNHLKRKASALELNYPDIHQGHIGPFTMQRQAVIADAHLKDALDKGAKLVLGGPSENLGGGFYMRPTILTEVTHDMRVMCEETFAPITPVMRYQTTEDAIRLANEGEYGLSAAVIAGSLDEARAIAVRLDAGAVSLQDAGLTLAIMRDAEKTSFNRSGLGGSRMGPNAIKRFFRIKALIAASAEPVEMETLRELPA